MTGSQFDSKQYFIGLMLIHGALIMGQLAFAAATYFIQSQGGEPFLQVELVIIISIAVFALMAILGGNAMVAARLRSLKSESDFTKKMNHYRTLSVVRYAFLEAPSLVSLVFFFLSSELFFLLISGLLILFLILVKPSRERAISELELNPAEQELLMY